MPTSCVQCIRCPCQNVKVALKNMVIVKVSCWRWLSQNSSGSASLSTMSDTEQKVSHKTAEYLLNLACALLFAPRRTFSGNSFRQAFGGIGWRQPFKRWKYGAITDFAVIIDHGNGKLLERRLCKMHIELKRFCKNYVFAHSKVRAVCAKDRNGKNCHRWQSDLCSAHKKEESWQHTIKHQCSVY